MIEHPQLLTGEYYLQRLSMFMRESETTCSHFDIAYSLLVKIDQIYDELFDQKNIFSQNYEENISQKIGVLNQIGSFFNCARRFTINDVVTSNPIEINFPNTDEGNKNYLTYIKCQIVKQNFQGTREELARLYKTYETGVVTETPILKDLLMVYFHEEGLASADCNIYWMNGEDFPTYMQDLFLNGYLTIESVGIRYKRYISNILDVGKFFELSNHQNPFISGAFRVTSFPATPSGEAGALYLLVDSNNVPVDPGTVKRVVVDPTTSVKSLEQVWFYQFADGLSEESETPSEATHGAKFA